MQLLSEQFMYKNNIITNLLNYHPNINQIIK